MRRRGIQVVELLTTVVVGLLTLHLLTVQTETSKRDGASARLVELHQAGLAFKERFLLDIGSAIVVPGRASLTTDASRRQLSVLTWTGETQDRVYVVARRIRYHAERTGRGNGNYFLLRDGAPACSVPVTSLRFDSRLRGRQRVLSVYLVLVERDDTPSSHVARLPMRFECRLPVATGLRDLPDLVRFEEGP